MWCGLWIRAGYDIYLVHNGMVTGVFEWIEYPTTMQHQPEDSVCAAPLVFLVVYLCLLRPVMFPSQNASYSQ